MPDATKVTIPVGGMTCQHCVQSVLNAVSALPGVEKVDVDLQRGLAVVSGNGFDLAAIRTAIEDMGFDAGEAI